MRATIGTGFKLLILGIVAVAAAWLVWKSVPPYNLGAHGSAAEAVDSVAEAKTASGPKIGNCEIFPADNVWNTPIDKLPKAHKADAYVSSIGPLMKLHLDFGSNLDGGIPYTDIPRGTRRTGITFEYHDDSDLSNYPIPPDAPIEGGPNSTGDRHIILIDQQRCILYEIFDAHPKPDGTWTAGSGVKFDLTSNALRQSGLGSADAAGLPILPGLVRFDEVAAGEIDHALRFTIPHTQGDFIWPARHKASVIKDLDVPPMGTRFRLRASFDITGYSKANQVILTALKRYGMFLADNGGPMFINGVPDKRWDDADLHKLTNVTAADFEAVDEADWQLLPDSARVDPVELGH